MTTFKLLLYSFLTFTVMVLIVIVIVTIENLIHS